MRLQSNMVLSVHLNALETVQDARGSNRLVVFNPCYSNNYSQLAAKLPIQLGDPALLSLSGYGWLIIQGLECNARVGRLQGGGVHD